MELIPYVTQALTIFRHRRPRRVKTTVLAIFLLLGAILGYGFYWIMVKALKDMGVIKPNTVLHVVHLDLKGAPPKMRYLLELIPRLRKAGVTGFLVEYEDMFPYEGWLKNISSISPYTKAEIQQFVHDSATNNIEVIPLIQTFGHMEHVLKQEEFRHLRETPIDSRAICPSDPRSMDLIKEMITQVLNLNKYSKRIHIGCDEVYNLNQCARCFKKHKPNMVMFTDHIREIATFIRNRYNNTITPLIWDDMLRWTQPTWITTSNIHNLVEIVIWDYTAELEDLIREVIFLKFSLIFKKVWVAGAFKGADGSKAMLPLMKSRYDNHKSWMEMIRKNAKWNIIPGFISTGWSRYDHLASLCELLPASMPSLMLNTLRVSNELSLPRDYIDDYNNMLRCHPADHVLKPYLIDDIYNLSHTNYCSFPESRLVYNTWKLEQLQKEIKGMYEELYENSGWISEYHLRNNFLSTAEVKKQYTYKSFATIYSSFFHVSTDLKHELEKYYRDNTIKEWIETHIEPYSSKLAVLKYVRDKAIKTNVWPRRNP